MVKVVAGIDRRAPIHDPPMLRAEAVIDFLLQFADVDTIDEPGYGNETGADIVVEGVVCEMQAVAVELQALSGTGVMIAVSLVPGAKWVGVGFTVVRRVSRTEEVAENITGAGNGLAVERPVRAELHTPIDATDTVVLIGAGTFPIGVQRADAGLVPNVAGHSRDGEVRADAG